LEVAMVTFISIVMLVLIIGGYALLKHDKKTKGYYDVIGLDHLGGIPGVKQGEQVIIYFYPDKFTINEKQIIPLIRITNVKVLEESKISEKQKSVLKRAIAGGILFGGVGAVIGGMSGIGTKQKELKVYLLSIDYLNKNGIEFNALFSLKFRDRLDYKLNIDKLRENAMRFNNKINQVPIDTPGPYEI